MLNSLKCRGFTMIELMVAMLIGLLLSLGLTTFLINNIKSNGDTLKAIRLNQEMRATMLLMTRDLRRAGYWNSTASSGNPFQTITISTAGCILYTYDRNGTGSSTVPSDVKYGFQKSASAVYMRSSGSTYNCTQGVNNAWEAVTDASMTTITGLSFVASQASSVIVVTMAGQLAKDSSVKQTLTESVKLENSPASGPMTFN